MPIGALIPPLVAKIRREVKEWRDSGYVGASDTSQALLWWWFQEPHHAENGGEFRYYFSQQEAMESIIYLYEVKAVKDKHDLGRFDSSGQFIPANLPENWRRFVVKMATGSGKTKVIRAGLLLGLFFTNAMRKIRNYHAISCWLRRISSSLIGLSVILMGCEFFMMTLCCPKTVLPDKIGVMTSKCAYIVKMKCAL